jgi:hypothetical protein
MNMGPKIEMTQPPKAFFEKDYKGASKNYLFMALNVMRNYNKESK